MDFLFCYHVILMLVASLAFTLLVVGFATPGWLLVTFEETLTKRQYTVSSLNRSLWFDVLCPRELLDCKTCVHSESQNCVNQLGYPGYSGHYEWVIAESNRNDKAQWEVWQGLETTSVVCAFLGFILVVCIVCCLLKPSNYRITCTIGFVLWAIAGILVWPVVGMVAALHVDIRDEINNNVIHDASLDTPYSLILSAVGGFLAIITALMLLWLVGLCRRKDDDTSTTLIDERRTQKASVLRSQQSYHGPYGYYPPEVQTEYRDAPRREYVREHSVTTDEEFYIVDSPYYVPAYYNRYYGSDFYDKKRRRDESGNGSGVSVKR